MTQPECKPIVQQEIPTRPEATYVTLSAVAGVTERDKTKTTPSHRQAARPAVVPPAKASNPPTIVKRKTEEYLQHEVVVKKSTHVPAGIPKGAWHPNVERKRPMAIARHTNVKHTIKVQSPAANSRVSRLVPDANMPSSNLEVTGAASRILPVNLSKNCKAEKTETGLNNRRGATCERPDDRNLSAQIDGPNTFWTCAFCSNKLDTLLELTAHVYEKHQDGLFLHECEPCNFQTEDPRLAREHQTRVHDTNTTATAKPAAIA